MMTFEKKRMKTNLFSDCELLFINQWVSRVHSIDSCTILNYWHIRKVPHSNPSMKHTTILFLLLSPIRAFIVQPVNLRNKISALSSKKVEVNESEKSESISRRDLGVKTSSALLTAAAIGFDSKAAFAEEGREGRLIEFQVENLGGEPGNTGRFVIKTNPDWAPNGVNR